jgi:raffinose/stachyose/melibiose transport system substrate-binding protein
MSEHSELKPRGTEMKKAISVVLSMILAVAALASCNSAQSQAANPPASQTASAAPATQAPIQEEAPPESAKPVELTFIFADGDEAFKSSMNKAVDTFNSANPGIIIRIQPGDGGAYSEFLKTKDSVGEFPDMMEMRDTAMYVRAGKLDALSSGIEDLFKTTMKFDGKSYTTPYAGENTNGILYN